MTREIKWYHTRKLRVPIGSQKHCLISTLYYKEGLPDGVRDPRNEVNWKQKFPGTTGLYTVSETYSTLNFFKTNLCGILIHKDLS